LPKKDADGNFIELTENPVSGGREVPVTNGMGKYEVGASGEGLQHYSGAVEVQGPDENRASILSKQNIKLPKERR
jgi:hypothetical protein